MSTSTRCVEETREKFNQNFKDLAKVIYKQEEQIRFLDTKSMNLVMFYVAAQLGFFLFSSKPSVHQCRNWWRIAGISWSITVIFGLNFAATVTKYLRTTFAQDRNYDDQGDNYLQMATLERKIRTGKVADMVEIDLPAAAEQREPDPMVAVQRYIHAGVTVSALIAFKFLVLQACKSFVCP